ncbi:MAG: hypothetical protein QOF48_1473 [Verrucomicrobiota bacterium]|jgi:hypothetical protein
MKTAFAILVVSITVAARAQESAAAPPTTPPQFRIKTPHEIVHDSVRHAFTVAQKAVEGAAGVAASALSEGSASFRDPVTLEQQGGSRSFSTSVAAPRGNRSLVIHSSETEASILASTEEDLTIMARILDKAARNSPEDGRHSVLGISVDGGILGSSSGARNIYLDGYGALFLLSVKYPLIAPPERPEEPKGKDVSSDDWKRARDEIQGSLRNGQEAQFETWTSSALRGPVEEFDAERVEKLKDSLLESLKNATNIRALKPGDFITVVVQGADVVRADVKRNRTPALDKPEATRSGYTVVRKSGGGGQSVMTLRVKKSDADAFAQGKLTPEEFRKKAAIQTYFRKPESTAANYFMQTVR